MSENNLRVLPGDINQLGATALNDGTNFALYAADATAVKIHLLDNQGTETHTLDLLPDKSHVWNGFVPGIEAGQRYQLSVPGPNKPEAGLRHNENKRLLDPYAKEVDIRHLEGENQAKRFDEANFGYPWLDPLRDLAFNATPNADKVPYSVVTAPRPADGHIHPGTPWEQTIICELSVDKFTAACPILPEGIKPGSFTALASDPAINLMHATGITAVELLPIHLAQPQGQLHARGLKDEWRYNSIGFFAPNPEFGTPDEFRAMVEKLHSEGIEVILDVVYNHTGEGNEMGPTISFKGIDNRTYYQPRFHKEQGSDGSWHVKKDENGKAYSNPRLYEDGHTGCGNTLNVANPIVQNMILDSLRYWVTEMHVDGFRFDLGSVLGEDANGEHTGDEFLKKIEDATAGLIVAPDGSRKDVKLIMEPWHPGSDGQDYEFSDRWKVWSLNFRDSARNIIRTGASAKEMLRVMTKMPENSVNFVVAHDGPTRLDMSMYQKKNNWINGEGNRDGDDINGWNCGVEGPSADPNIIALRHDQVENSLAINILAQKGVPMLHESDFDWKTRRGLTNAYCTEQPMDWSKIDPTHIRFIGKLTELKKKFSGQMTLVNVFDTAGNKLSAEQVESQPDWVKACCVEFQTVAKGGRQEHYLLALNTHCDPVNARLPTLNGGELWKLVSDTHGTEDQSRPTSYANIFGRSVQVLKAVKTSSDKTPGTPPTFIEKNQAGPNGDLVPSL